MIGRLTAGSLVAAVLEGATGVLIPDRCGGCDRYGALLCDRCAAEIALLGQVPACPTCAAPYGDLVCTECKPDELAFSSCGALGQLDGALARMVVLYKDSNDRRLGPLLGMLLGQRLLLRWPRWGGAVTWVPPSRRSLYLRGFDHARGIADGVAWAVGTVAHPLLVHAGGADLRGRGRAQRATSAHGAFRTVECTSVPKRVILVDDVMTTGTTANECSQLLLASGAEEVRAAVLARAW